MPSESTSPKPSAPSIMTLLRNILLQTVHFEHSRLIGTKFSQNGTAYRFMVTVSYLEDLPDEISEEGVFLTHSKYLSELDGGSYNIVDIFEQTAKDGSVELLILIDFTFELEDGCGKKKGDGKRRKK